MKSGVRLNTLTVFFFVAITVLALGIWYLFLAIVAPSEETHVERIREFFLLPSEYRWFAWIVALFVSVLSAAYFGALIALRRAPGQKQWESKYMAYQELLQSMSELQTWAEETHNDLLRSPVISETRLAELSHEYEVARRTLWGQARVGALTMSDSSVAALQELLREIKAERFRFTAQSAENSNSVHEYTVHCDKLKVLLNSHFAALLQMARKDLG
ncbi:MAG: hypothetical protein V4568_07980 [Pseudomonadota bacterium]